MLYIDFETKDKSYKLRLTTRNVMKLEKTLGRNPVSIFADIRNGTIPTVTDMIKVLHASLLAYYDDMTEEQACEVFDAWVENGNCINDFIAVLIQIFEEAGLLEKTKN